MFPQHMDTVLEAFMGYQEGVKVSIEGKGSYDNKGTLRTMDDIDDVRLLDSWDVPAQLETMKSLQTGWANGCSFLAMLTPLMGCLPTRRPGLVGRSVCQRTL